MKILQLSCVFGFGPVLGLASILILGTTENWNATVTPSAKSQIDQDVKKNESRIVPLESIYSTSNQKGIIRLPGTKYKQLEPTFEDFYRDMRGVGASNVFLAQADDIQDAVLASWEVYIAWQTCDTPARTTKSKKSDKIWLAAYLGIATSGPPAWEVKSVEVDGKKVRLKYTKGGKSTTTDRRQYHVWAPLGALPPGTYSLELFDEDRGIVTLSRHVTIAAKK